VRPQPTSTSVTEPGRAFGVNPGASAVLRRAGLHRRDRMHRVSCEVVRYERGRLGELLHLDVKKLGRSPPGGGKRFAPGFARTRSGPKGKGGGGPGCVHVAVDGRSQYAYAEALPDERGVTTAVFLVDRAITRFADLGCGWSGCSRTTAGTTRHTPSADEGRAALFAPIRGEARSAGLTVGAMAPTRPESAFRMGPP